MEISFQVGDEKHKSQVEILHNFEGQIKDKQRQSWKLKKITKINEEKHKHNYISKQTSDTNARPHFFNDNNFSRRKINCEL